MTFQFLSNISYNTTTTSTIESIELRSVTSYVTAFSQKRPSDQQQSQVPGELHIGSRTILGSGLSTNTYSIQEHNKFDDQLQQSPLKLENERNTINDLNPRMNNTKLGLAEDIVSNVFNKTHGGKIGQRWEDDSYQGRNSEINGTKYLRSNIDDHSTNLNVTREDVGILARKPLGVSEYTLRQNETGKITESFSLVSGQPQIRSLSSDTGSKQTDLVESLTAKKIYNATGMVQSEPETSSNDVTSTIPQIVDSQLVRNKQRPNLIGSTLCQQQLYMSKPHLNVNLQQQSVSTADVTGCGTIGSGLTAIATENEKSIFPSDSWESLDLQQRTQFTPGVFGSNVFNKKSNAMSTLLGRRWPTPDDSPIFENGVIQNTSSSRYPINQASFLEANQKQSQSALAMLRGTSVDSGLRTPFIEHSWVINGVQTPAKTPDNNTSIDTNAKNTTITEDELLNGELEFYVPNYFDVNALPSSINDAISISSSTNWRTRHQQSTTLMYQQYQQRRQQKERQTQQLSQQTSVNQQHTQVNDVNGDVTTQPWYVEHLLFDGMEQQDNAIASMNDIFPDYGMLGELSVPSGSVCNTQMLVPSMSTSTSATGTTGIVHHSTSTVLDDICSCNGENMDFVAGQSIQPNNALSMAMPIAMPIALQYGQNAYSSTGKNRTLPMSQVQGHGVLQESLLWTQDSHQNGSRRDVMPSNDNCISNRELQLGYEIDSNSVLDNISNTRCDSTLYSRMNIEPAVADVSTTKVDSYGAVSSGTDALDSPARGRRRGRLRSRQSDDTSSILTTSVGNDVMRHTTTTGRSSVLGLMSGNATSVVGLPTTRGNGIPITNNLSTTSVEGTRRARGRRKFVELPQDSADAARALQMGEAPPADLFGVLGDVVFDNGRQIGIFHSNGTGEGGSETPYSCIDCQRAFARIHALRSHMRCHDERRFACSQCTMRFRRNHDLRRHQRSLHDGGKPLQCSGCRRRFARADALRRHQTNRASDPWCRAASNVASSTGSSSGNVRQTSTNHH